MNFEFCSGQALVKSIIQYQVAARGRGLHWSIAKKWASMRVKLMSLLTASDIDREASICPDLKLPHPVGVVIHRDATIGPGCMIMQLVTIGQVADGAVPRIGAGVYIGAGAKLLGGITIGDHARIGANAVVLEDVPDNTTAVGIPARVIHRSVAPASGPDTPLSTIDT